MKYESPKLRLVQKVGFSLIEVLLALSICSFAILLIVALLPIGTQVTRESLEETGAVNVFSKVLADRLATPIDQESSIYKLPAITNGSTEKQTKIFGIKDDNEYLDSNLGGARYRVECVITPPADKRLDPSFVYLRVSWPAGSVVPNGVFEGTVTLPTP